MLQALLSSTWRDGATLASGSPPTATLPPSQQQQQQQQPQGQKEKQGDQLQQRQAQVQQQKRRISPLHSCWSSLFTGMLQMGHVELALLAFDQMALTTSRPAAWAGHGFSPEEQHEEQKQEQPQPQQQEKCVPALPFTEEEACRLIGAARIAASLAASLTLGLLSPYEAQQQAAIGQLRGSCLSACDPWVVHLLWAVVARGRFAQLAVAGPGAGAAEQQPSEAQQCLQQQPAFSQLCALLCNAASHLSATSGMAASRQQLPAAAAAAAGVTGADVAEVAGDVIGGVVEVLLPHAVCQLVAGGHYGTAAQLVAARLQFHPVLSSFGGAMLVLERYLSCILHACTESKEGVVHAEQVCPLPGCGALLQCCLPIAARKSYERLAATTRPG